ncbi:hypothetical protein DV738_g3291, partial [Chaetothyriales sp. CBS 135597]
MPFHDLNLQYTPGTPPSSISHTLAFAAELGYLTVALNTSITGKVPSQPPTVPTSSLTVPPGMTVLTRLTLTVSDTSQNHRLSALQSTYDLLALRPTNEKALQLCCSTLQCDLISIDFSQRLPFVLKFKTVSSALQRGVRFEINYSPGISGGSDARRNLIAGATALIRASRSRGIILSSEASNALGLRGPHDVINLACVWGLSQERGKEGICEETDKVVRLARLKRETYRGVVAVVDHGQFEHKTTNASKRFIAAKAEPPKGEDRQEDMPEQHGARLVNGTDLKRKASSSSLNSPSTGTQPTDAAGKPLSKRELKRRAKKARFEASQTSGKGSSSQPEGPSALEDVSDSDDDDKSEDVSAKDDDGTGVLLLSSTLLVELSVWAELLAAVIGDSGSGSDEVSAELELKLELVEWSELTGVPTLSDDVPAPGTDDVDDDVAGVVTAGAAAAASAGAVTPVWNAETAGIELSPGESAPDAVVRIGALLHRRLSHQFVQHALLVWTISLETVRLMLSSG